MVENQRTFFYFHLQQSSEQLWRPNPCGREFRRSDGETSCRKISLGCSPKRTTWDFGIGKPILVKTQQYDMYERYYYLIITKTDLVFKKLWHFFRHDNHTVHRWTQNENPRWGLMKLLPKQSMCTTYHPRKLSYARFWASNYSLRETVFSNSTTCWKKWAKVRLG